MSGQLSCQGKRGYLLALIAGAIAPLSFAPFGYWPFGILSLVGLLICLQNISPRRAAWAGWFYGLGLYGSGVSWVYHSIHDYGYAPVPLAAFLTLLFVAGLSLLFTASFTYSYVRFFNHRSNAILFAFPALWVLFEWVRSWLFTGFPWLLMGYAHTDTLLGDWAPVLGVYGISFIVAMSAACLYLLGSKINLKAFSPSLLTYALLLAAPWLIALGLKQMAWVESQGSLQATLLQPNITQDVKWQPQQRQKTLQLLYRETGKHLTSDIIVWPENAVPLFYHQAGPFLDEIQSVARASETTVITGIPYWQPAKDSPQGVNTAHNSITSLGLGEGIYHKQKLVPFGEYVPLQKLLRGLIQFFNLPMSDFKRGPSEQPPLTATINGEAIQIAPYICYEIVYPDFTRQLAQQSDLLLTISDDSWFGTSAGPHQHLQMARMRAMENGRYLLRGTNTGVTALIDHQGKLIAQSPQFSQQSLSGQVQLMTGQTLFGRTGSWVILGLCLLLLVTLLTQRPIVRD